MPSQFPTFRRLWKRFWAFGHLRGTDRPFSTWWPRHTTSAQRQSLLRLIAVASEEKLPLAPLIDAWANDERGQQRWRLRRLADLLRSGTPLPDAVEEVPGVLTDEDVLAIRFGAQSGTLTAAVRTALDAAPPDPASRTPRLRDPFVYAFAVLCVGALIVTFLQIKIVPEFVKILREFDLDALPVLVWSVGLSRIVADYWWVGALAAIVVSLALSSARPGRFMRHAVFARLFGSLRELRSAEVLQKLSVATTAGRPISGALSTLARYHFEPSIRHKLLFVRNEVEQGADVWQSMGRVGLVTPPEATLLATADRVGNRTWVLGQLARSKKRRTLRRWERLSEMLFPAVVLLMGAFVLFETLTVFVPLTQLIYGQL